MKEAHLEYRDLKSSDELWVQCKQQASEVTSKDRSLEAAIIEFSKEIIVMQMKMQQFTDFLRRIPLLAAFGHWIKGISTMDQFWQEKYRKGTKSLLEKSLIPFCNSQGENLRLEEFQQIGHQGILENIRCVKEWGFIQKEEAVQCYLQFSHSLSRNTMNFIPPGFDPDRDKTRNRSIKYETFIEFVQHLSERDALIAKLLYFGTPSMDEVLSLKRDAIIPEDSVIRFQEREVILPKHLMQDLLSYILEKEDKQELVFTNVRGAEVERAHLNHAFSRASEKIAAQIKITPGGLLRLENETA